MKNCLLLLLVLISVKVFPQSITGNVKDAEGNLLQNARIELSGLPFAAYSDLNGAFVFRKIKPGNYTITVNRLGYSIYKSDFYHSTDDTELNITVNNEPVELSENVVVTAERFTNLQYESPSAISHYDGNLNDKRIPRSIAEALIGVTGLWMQKTNHGGGSPFIRGLTGNQSLIMIDGIRLNNSTFRYGPNQYLNTINSLFIDRVEVLRGNGSVQYGSDALGGVLQILTKSPHLSSKEYYHITAEGKYMSDDMEKTSALEFEYGSEQFGVYASGSYSDYGDIKAGGDLGFETSSAYKEFSGNIKLLTKLNDNLYLTGTYQILRQDDVGRYDQVAQRGFEYYKFDPQVRHLAFLRGEYNTNGPIESLIRVTASYQNSDETRIYKKSGSSIENTDIDIVDVYGLNLEYISKIQRNWNVSAGVDVYYDKVSKSITTTHDFANGTDSSSRGLYPAGADSRNISLYMLNKLKFSNLILTGGLRYNNNETTVEDDIFGLTVIEPFSVTYSIGALYNIYGSHHIAANYFTGFRNPNINDMSTFGLFDFGLEIPSTGLESETSSTYEFGYKIDHEIVKGSFFVFYTELNDLIARVRTTFRGSSEYNGEPVYTKANVGDAFIRGFEIEMETNITSIINVYGNLVYIYGQNESADEPLRRMPPLNGKLGIKYFQKDWWINGELLIAEKQDRLSGGDIDDHRIPDGGTPGWTVLNIYGGYEFEVISLSAGLQNIFDEEYRIHGSGVDGYGRSLFVSARLNLTYN